MAVRGQCAAGHEVTAGGGRRGCPGCRRGQVVLLAAAAEGSLQLPVVAAAVRAHKAAATGPPPIAVLGWLFRPLAALGGYHWYMNHQHRSHTLVSHVRGPAERVTFGGSPITAAIPVGVAEGGNVTAYFEVLSYAGTLTLTAITDPEHFPDPGTLTDALHAGLDQIIHHRPVPR